MPEMDDMALVRDYAERKSEEAFDVLVKRHVNLVYSVALRQTNNPHHAEEVTQAVFVVLARKAGSLGYKTILPGWLYQTTRLTTANLLRGEARRARREQEAYMQSLLNEQETDEAWQQLVPLLEEVMGGLGSKDRDAVVLRFFGGKSLGEVGAALGTSEDAAKMRVNRALEKLRTLFNKRGVVMSAAAIGAAVAANAVQAAPGQLVSVVTAGLNKVAASTSLSLLVKATLQQLLWLKLRTTLLVALALSVAGGGLILNQARQQPDFSRQLVIPLPTNVLTRQPPSSGPAVIRIKLLGTQGLPFEVTYSTEGQSQIAKGLLPDEVSFNADAFTASISVQGPGEFGFELFRGNLQQASATVGPIPADHSINIVAQAGGRGIRMTKKPD